MLFRKIARTWVFGEFSNIYVVAEMKITLQIFKYTLLKKDPTACEISLLFSLYCFDTVRFTTTISQTDTE